MRKRQVLIAVVAICLCASAPAAAARPPFPLLNPKTYVSPSGEYRLHVDATTPTGAGAGIYRLTRNEQEIWSGKHPFALRDAAVTDSGVVGGYAYTGGTHRAGEVVFALLDADGNVRLHDATAQRPAKYGENGRPAPEAEGVYFQPDQDRFVARLGDEDRYRGEETWKVFRASDGTLIDTFVPKQRSKVTADRRIVSAHPVAGTPLVLVHWFTFRRAALGPKGCAFELLDLEGRSLWTLELPDDYEVKNAGELDTDFRRRALKHGVLSVGTATFDVWLAKDNQRVSFAIKRAETGGQWRIEEVKREPFDAPKPLPPGSADLKIQLVQLEHLGTIHLGAPPGVPPPPGTLDHIGAITTDARGQVYALDWRSGAVHVFSSLGEPLRVLVPEPMDLSEHLLGAKLSVDAAGSVYVADIISTEFVRFDASGKRSGRAVPPAWGSVKAWHFMPTGQGQWVQGDDRITLVGPDGGVKQTIHRRPDRDWLSWIDGSAVAPDGSLAAITGPPGWPDGSPSGVHLYDAAGEPLRTIRGPAQTGVAFSGRWAIVPVDQDVYLYAADGSTLLKFTPEIPAGPRKHWHPLIGPDGTELWLLADWTRQIERFALPP